nr:hypothetical protein [Sphingobium xenophagum]
MRRKDHCAQGQKGNRIHRDGGKQAGQIEIDPEESERADEQDIGEIEQRPQCHERHEATIQLRTEGDLALSHEAAADPGNQRCEAGKLIAEAKRDTRRVDREGDGCVCRSYNDETQQLAALTGQIGPCA